MSTDSVVLERHSEGRMDANDHPAHQSPGFEEMIISPKGHRAVRRSFVPRDASPAELDRFRKEVEAYWTPERRAAAVPMDLEAIAARRGIRFPEPKPEEQLPYDTSELEITSSTTLVTNVTQPPYSSVGRLIFSWKGKPYYCSAVCVGPATVLTAGHCVWEDDVWSTGLVFEPQYNQGTSSLGSFAVIQACVSNEWRASQNWDFDYAFLTTAQSMTGVPALSINFTMPEKASGGCWALGYPGKSKSGYDFNGQQMWKAVGEYGVSHAWNFRRGEYWMINNMTEGASGGPWLIQQDGGGAAQVFSVTSGWARPPWTWKYMYGPRFDAATQFLYNAAASATQAQWAVPLPNGLNQPTWPLYFNDHLFVGSIGRVTQLDAATGGSALANTLSNLGSTEVRIATDGYRVFAGVNGNVAGIELNSFENLAWTKSLKGGSGVVNLVMGFEGLFAGCNGYVQQLNPPDGVIIETNGLSGYGYGEVRMAVDGESVYVGSNGQVGRIVRSNFSQLAWSTQLSKLPAPIVNVLLAGGQLFVGASGYLYAINPSTGTITASTPLPLPTGGGANTEVRLASDGTNVFAACAGAVTAWEIPTGNQFHQLWGQWANKQNPADPTSLLLRDEQVLVGCEGVVYWFDAANGKFILNHVLAANGQTELATRDMALIFAGINGTAYGIANVGTENE